MAMSRFLGVCCFLIIFSHYFGRAEPFLTSCELKAEVRIEDSISGQEGKSVRVIIEGGGVAPFKFLFFNEQTGQLLEKDFTKSYVDDLKNGDYYCIVIDNSNCSKKIQFSIQ